MSSVGRAADSYYAFTGIGRSWVRAPYRAFIFAFCCWPTWEPCHWMFFPFCATAARVWIAVALLWTTRASFLKDCSHSTGAWSLLSSLCRCCCSLVLFDQYSLPERTLLSFCSLTPTFSATSVPVSLDDHSGTTVSKGIFDAASPVCGHV